MPLQAAHHLGLDHHLLIVSLGDGVSPISFLNKKDGSLFILQSLQGLAGGVWKRKENGFSHRRTADLLNLYSSQVRGGCRGALSSEFSKYCSSYSQSYNYTELCQRRRRKNPAEKRRHCGNEMPVRWKHLLKYPPSFSSLFRFFRNVSDGSL